MIVVAGSVNMDVVFTVERFPARGETIMAIEHVTAHGGKGGNQAVAAARLDADVHFLGCVGDDALGTELRAGLSAEGVDVGRVRAVPGPSGTAVVAVDAEGENEIIVGAGANARLTLGREDHEMIERASIVLCQLEIPMATVLAVAASTSGTLVLNAAPATALPLELLDRVDVLIANEHELVTVAGSTDVAAIRSLGIETVVATLGSRGAQVVTSWDIGYIPAPEVPVVDTTGAGDAFCGAFVASLDDGHDVFSSASRAVVAGSLATTRVGARAGMPDAGRLERAMARRP